MAIDQFDPFITPVDFIKLNGRKSPGIAKVSGATDKRKWDVQVGYGYGGAITIYKGREISRFTVTITLNTARDWIDWASWRDLVSRPPNGFLPKKDLAFTIDHPWLKMLGIHEVSIEEVSQPEESDESGAWTISIKFLEFRLPALQLAKPEAAKDTAITDPQSLEIARKTAENIQKSAHRDALLLESGL